MFDSQKLSFDTYKTLKLLHGVYVFTRDTCQLCKDYKEEISYINNRYLYFVECVTSHQQDIISKEFDRTAFPLTVGIENNTVKFISVGMLFGDDFKKVTDFLKKFGDAPLNETEINERLKTLSEKKNFVFCLFPTSYDVNKKYEYRKKAFNERNEIVIDLNEILEYDDGFNKVLNIIKNRKDDDVFYVLNPMDDFNANEISVLSEYYRITETPMLIVSDK